ncbi:MAG TPA: DNA polymerase Y family protein [Kofleriaceae bacterium]|jgi:protein ImuB|nr:DNA polymerase Y family protein [Kofleriaceae bacterium]
MRVACLDLPAFPLQLVWRREPALRAAPVVVIDDDRPQGRVLWACERARQAGVLVGDRYAHALALCGGLQARVVPPLQIAEATTALGAALHRLSPRVEPGEPGTFWLDGEGLAQVFPEAGGPPGHAWSQAIARLLADQHYRGAVVVGGSRFATYAIARATRLGVVVPASDADERALAIAVPLARLDIEPALREALARLGVTRVGELVRLPAGGILERFGHDAHRLYQLAAGERWDPLVPVAPPEAPDERIVLDDDEADLERLVFASKAPIDRLLDRLAARGRAVTALHVELALKHAVGHVALRADCLKPAQPTLDGRALLRLLHLRLTGQPPAAPVNAIRVWADDVAATREQLALFAHRPRRDLRAADEALARLRAELGDAAVVCAVLREGHLPEARFSWAPLAQLAAARPAPEPPVPPLVRRMFTRPQQLAIQPRPGRDDGWLPSGPEHGAVTRLFGPYLVSGGWWTHELAREYHFAELRRGDCLWLYFDRNRQRWFCQGAVA